MDTVARRRSAAAPSRKLADVKMKLNAGTVAVDRVLRSSGWLCKLDIEPFVGILCASPQ